MAEARCVPYDRLVTLRTELRNLLGEVESALTDPTAEQQVCAEFRSRGKVAAVKLYRQLFGTNLSESVDGVKRIVGEDAWNPTDATPAPAPTAPEEEVIATLREDNAVLRHERDELLGTVRAYQEIRGPIIAFVRRVAVTARQNATEAQESARLAAQRADELEVQARRAEALPVDPRTAPMPEAPTAPEGKRPTTNRALEALDRIIDSWRASSVDGPNDDAWTKAHNETLRHCCDELAALSVAEHTRETEALERLAVHLRLHEAMHPEEAAPTPPTPTGGAQPEADEAEALARVLCDAGQAHCRSLIPDATLRPFDELDAEFQDEYRAMSTAALSYFRGGVARG